MGILIFTSQNDQKELKDLFNAGGYVDLEFSSDLGDLRKKLQINEPKSSSIRKSYNLILMDISVSRECLKICKELRESSPYFEVPLIVLSEDSSQEVFQMSFANGASDYLMKPIRGFELLTRTRVALKMKFEIDRRVSREKELIEATRQLSDVNAVLDRLSLVDSLTGIPNRRCFDQSLEQELRLSKRHNNALSLIMLDLDYFKAFNDTYGHQAGDQCLRSVADCISRCLRRPSDMICRYGGEEFAAILPETDEEGVAFIAEKIRSQIADEKIAHKKSQVSDTVTVSLGTSTCVPEMNISREQLIEQADKALYAAKLKGRNQSLSYSQALSEGALELPKSG